MIAPYALRIAMTSPTILSLVMLSVVSAPSAELVVRDFHLGASTRPLSFSYEFATPTKTTSGDDRFQNGIAFDAGGRWSLTRAGDRLGLVVGFDGIADYATYGTTNTDDGLSSFSGRGSLGLGWAITDRLTTVIEGGGRYGISTIALSSTATTPSINATGTANGYDIRWDTTWFLTRRFGLGLTAAWIITHHQMTDGDTTLNLNQSGWAVGLQAVWKFSDTPPRIE